MDKLYHHQNFIDATSFDDVANLPSHLESQKQQLQHFEENFEVL